MSACVYARGGAGGRVACVRVCVRACVRAHAALLCGAARAASSVQTLQGFCLPAVNESRRAAAGCCWCSRRRARRCTWSGVHRIWGLYKVNDFEPFVVMESIFPLKAGVPIHLVYDLKGSWHGREIKEKEKAAKVIIYKDNDFENDVKRAFKFDKQRREWFLANLKRSVGFLERYKVRGLAFLVPACLLAAAFCPPDRPSDRLYFGLG
eukprot:SAG22_NODE_1765_length_3624_cov_2.026667_6_plen_208_part_00